MFALTSRDPPLVKQTGEIIKKLFYLLTVTKLVAVSFYATKKVQFAQELHRKQRDEQAECSRSYGYGN